jgi:hypothetical protein
MEDSMPWVLNQAVVEVQYDRGVVYLDRCGTLTLRLQDELGRPFEASLPNMDSGELKNPAERLTVSYGPKSFSVTQSWVRSIARVEQLAPAAWDHVGSVLDVGGQVTRCGVRFVLAFRVPTLAEGEERIARSALCVEAPAWREAFGVPIGRTWNFVSEDHHGKLRVTVSAIEWKVHGGTLPPDLANLIPPAAILLDVDHIFPSSPDGPAKVSKAQLKDFIRAAWQRTKKGANTIRETLGIANDVV